MISLDFLSPQIMAILLVSVAGFLVVLGLAMPMLKKENIGAINWGLVKGKTNTIYQWDTPIDSGEEPVEWFHDIFRKDGTPYRQDEVDLIKKLNGIK